MLCLIVVYGRLCLGSTLPGFEWSREAVPLLQRRHPQTSTEWVLSLLGPFFFLLQLHMPSGPSTARNQIVSIDVPGAPQRGRGYCSNSPNSNLSQQLRCTGLEKSL